MVKKKTLKKNRTKLKFLRENKKKIKKIPQ